MAFTSMPPGCEARDACDVRDVPDAGLGPAAAGTQTTPATRGTPQPHPQPAAHRNHTRNPRHTAITSNSGTLTPADRWHTGTSQPDPGRAQPDQPGARIPGMPACPCCHCAGGREPARCHNAPVLTGALPHCAGQPLLPGVPSAPAGRGQAAPGTPAVPGAPAALAVPHRGAARGSRNRPHPHLHRYADTAARPVAYTDHVARNARASGVEPIAEACYCNAATSATFRR
jgi:hypothetical protein